LLTVYSRERERENEEERAAGTISSDGRALLEASLEELGKVGRETTTTTK
jgi:hypothetical protein